MIPSRRAIIAAITLALFVTPSIAQDWPSKPVRMIVPFPPGGGTDIISRVIANKLGEALKQPIIVENRPGAGGNIGIDLTAKAAPDGYTIVMGQTSNLAINATLYAKLPYDPIKDLAPVALVADAPLALVVRAESPFKTLADVLAAARAKPGELTFASPGNGTVAHLTGELMQKTAAIKLLHVPYKGSSPALTDLLGGTIDLFMASVPTSLGQIKGGKIRALAVSSAKRAPNLPDVPTIGEAGLPGFDATTWWGVLAPAGTPGTIVARLNATINAALATPEVREKIALEGGGAMGGSAEAFASVLKSDLDRWSEIVKSSGATVD